MKISKTFTANIYLGLKEGYDGIQHEVYEAEIVCEDYCNRVGFAVTITPTRFIYTNGYEVGCIIGLINYPRFPSTAEEITAKAVELAVLLMNKFKQQRISIVCSDSTYMIEAQNEPGG